MSCPPYEKIDTLYERDKNFKVDTTKLRRPEFAIPREWIVTEKIDGTNCRISLELEHDTTTPCSSVCACAVEWVVRFYGRTENSQMPTFLLEYLQKTFTLKGLKSLWRCKSNCEKCGGEGIVAFGDSSQGRGGYAGQTVTSGPCLNFEPYPITLYGEGYGAKIQKGGGNYRRDGDVSFRLFDVLIGDIWLRRADVEDVAKQLDIEPVPLLVDPPWALGICVDMVRDKETPLGSVVAFIEGVPRVAEGIVAFTDPPLFNGQGKRLMWKLKVKDFDVEK